MNRMICYRALAVIGAYSTFLVLLNGWVLHGRRWVDDQRLIAMRSAVALRKWTHRTPSFVLMRRAPSSGRCPNGAGRQAAFTLIELLVVIGILAILIGMLLPVVSKTRLAALRVKATANVRELLIGYTQYHQANNGSLCFGFTPFTVNGTPVVVSDPNTGFDYGVPIADRYPWRLVKYCSNVWAILHQHTDLPPIPRAGDSSATAFSKAYMLSLNPSFGINGIYLGGHSGFSGFAGPSGDIPNIGRHVAFKASEVRRSGQIIVFSETQVRNVPGMDPTIGLHYVTPPRANGQKWKIVNGKFVLTSGMITGLPQGRYGPRTVVGFFDGHAEQLLPSDLEDMRLWAPRATAADYDFVP